MITVELEANGSMYNAIRWNWAFDWIEKGNTS